MTAQQPPQRGAHLLDAERGLVAGSLWSKLWARGQSKVFERIVDAIDKGLEYGTIEGHLPDGTTRIVGGRGEGSYGEITIHSWMTFVRLANSGSVGFYVGWSRGEWSSPDPVKIFDLFMRNARALGGTARAKGIWRIAHRLIHRLNRNSAAGAKRNIAAHYDLGNDFYATWLDDTMSYSSAIFDDRGEGLETAQRRKVAAISERLRLSVGDKLLEIGCGWGHLANEFAERGIDTTAITLSEEQRSWAQGRYLSPDKALHYDLVDYRNMHGQFDGIASVEMVEAVGQSYWPTYLDCIARNLKPGGRAAIQYIAIDEGLFADYAASADFIQTYIFPGGMLLSTERFKALASDRRLSWKDETRFGEDYADTLKHWRDRFELAIEEKRLPVGFDKRFRDLWRYYLMYCEGGFRGGGIWVAQVTLIKEGKRT